MKVLYGKVTSPVELEVDKENSAMTNSSDDDEILDKEIDNDGIMNTTISCLFQNVMKNPDINEFVGKMWKIVKIFRKSLTKSDERMN